MNSKKNAVPGVAAPKDGRKDWAAEAAFSVSDYTMNRGMVSSVLLTGRDNALPGREIRRILSLQEARDVSALVERERRNGIPICASCDSRTPGYYLPATVGELEEYINSLRGRVREVRRTLEALEAAHDRLSGQIRFDGKDGTIHG